VREESRGSALKTPHRAIEGAFLDIPQPNTAVAGCGDGEALSVLRTGCDLSRVPRKDRPQATTGDIPDTKGTVRGPGEDCRAVEIDKGAASDFAAVPHGHAAVQTVVRERLEQAEGRLRSWKAEKTSNRFGSPPLGP
jgi:hypothetical protein